jgi:hypothetical protein
MKVLLDENLDHALRKLLGHHQVVTVNYMGWNGIQNGALLRVAEDSEMDVLLTGDQTLAYEQNLVGRRLAIVALAAIPATHSYRESFQYHCRNRSSRSRLVSTR